MKKHQCCPQDCLVWLIVPMSPAVREYEIKWKFVFPVKPQGGQSWLGACSCPSVSAHPGTSMALSLPCLPALCYLPSSWLWPGNMASSSSSLCSLSSFFLLSREKMFMSNLTLTDFLVDLSSPSAHFLFPHRSLFWWQVFRSPLSFALALHSVV